MNESNIDFTVSEYFSLVGSSIDQLLSEGYLHSGTRSDIGNGYSEYEEVFFNKDTHEYGVIYKLLNTSNNEVSKLYMNGHVDYLSYDKDHFDLSLDNIKLDFKVDVNELKELVK